MRRVKQLKRAHRLRALRAAYGPGDTLPAVQHDDEEGDDVPTDARRAHLVGERDGDGFDSADDEEIESDDAFEEADEERFAGFNFASDRVRNTPFLFLFSMC